MKKFVLFFILFIAVIATYADEGMWVPLFLEKYNIEDMQKKGFKLSAEDIYSVNKASMKDAVMIFGGGCTAELISDKGLILTNYHCGYSNIQKHSSVENDYLTEGFWAMSANEELPNPGLSVTFLVYMKDVTNRVLDVFDETMEISVRKIKIDSVCSVIEKETLKKSDGKYQAEVEPFFYGNQYIVVVTQTYKDVRLVGAPPSAIGKFGGDTDNWVWPRHTGDFSLFRIYADENNQPAEYSSDNVPYKPKKFFPINISGVDQGDFTMIFGYPAYTKEYIPSYLVDNIINVVNPLRIEIRQKKLDIINQAINVDKQTRIQYASKQSRISNGWKKWIGQNQGLKRIEILKEKKEYEKKFQKWADNQKNPFYKNILPEYKKIAKKIKPYKKAYYSFIECVYYTDLWKIYKSMTNKLSDISQAYTNQKVDSLKAIALKSAENFYKDYRFDIDKAIFKQLMLSYFNEVESEFYPDFYSIIEKDYDSDIEAYVEYVYNQSIFTNEEKMIDFIKKYYNGKNDYKKQNPQKAVFTKKDYEDDPVIQIIDDFVMMYNFSILLGYKPLQNKIDSLNHLYMQAQMKMEPDKIFYPDANFTLRVGYGSVKGFKPRDGLIYDYYTTLEGVIEKDNPEIYDYKVPKKLKKLYKNKDFGRYADKDDGKIHVCFIGDNHTSGGNSGSPVINANGELIGINFDRCWESTMSDIKFDPNYCRNIMLDVRYVLFIIDKYADADYLIDEMEIIE